MTYTLQMDNDELDKLDELAQIVGRVADLMGEATFSDDEAIDSVEAIQRLRLAGNNEDADELAKLILRADELKARHRP